MLILVAGSAIPDKVLFIGLPDNILCALSGLSIADTCLIATGMPFCPTVTQSQILPTVECTHVVHLLECDIRGMQRNCDNHTGEHQAGECQQYGENF